ncbi:MAG: hypothetical protein ABIK96_10665 [bacterium]|nr:hypothetical protein [bacterium]
MEQLIARILADAPLRTHRFHGRPHWDRVAEFGRRIAAAEDLESRLITLFAYFHDSKRENEGIDPDHGPRAADYVLTFAASELRISPGDRERLAFACRYHTHEEPTDDWTILACWDADRLDLGRVGITPDPDRLHTATAKMIACRDLRPESR